MTRSWNKMTYDKDGACWVVYLGGRSYTLHCGECIEIRIGDKGIPCRIELDRDWYVIMREARFNLRKKETYQVDI
ncbi:hypothetical protein SD70_04050 [Gordoniibacillus kamchatkensis]|uniref:DUF5348 domain-containing protein n=1 Tax=Gordoniibacillus kamchatkensis TaxID=1590651 RepID=A0ABR5ALX0_9BACL|nr:DUF5348 domain-containing protein [Paenibacillus sp. VKM B-2647]KIL41922.1 hypothetical protein SD70_03275 [Paenibacillus sp. VKM B-2647]KIL42029.1 hypothetical protein SD70_04050 [Paenibacillus sp. VKM B-2647]